MEKNKSTKKSSKTSKKKKIKEKDFIAFKS